jgi:hypothetical protein
MVLNLGGVGIAGSGSDDLGSDDPGDELSSELVEGEPEVG